MTTTQVTFSVNGNTYYMSVGKLFGQISPNEVLLDTLRNRLGLKGSKPACRDGACGCCTVIIEGKAVPSCDILTVDCEGKSVTTIEGLAKADGTLDPVQQTFLDFYAYQCGYCTPGIIMVARALLDKNPHPSRAEIEDALSGNFCRCISQYHVLDAIEHLAREGG